MGRALHLVDLANLLGSSRPVPDMGELAREALVVGGWHPADHVVVGLNSRLARVAATTFSPPFAVRWHPGRSGGVHALLRYAADPRQLARSYDKLVIGSGDGRFAHLAETARSQRVAVWLVIGQGKPSTALIRAATRCVRLRRSGTAPAGAGKDRARPAFRGLLLGPVVTIAGSSPTRYAEPRKAWVA